jgi:hypothetical protein
MPKFQRKPKTLHLGLHPTIRQTLHAIVNVKAVQLSVIGHTFQMHHDTCCGSRSSSHNDSGSS